jgi:hypothetical protein
MPDFATGDRHKRKGAAIAALSPPHMAEQAGRVNKIPRGGLRG